MFGMKKIEHYTQTKCQSFPAHAKSVSAHVRSLYLDEIESLSFVSLGYRPPLMPKCATIAVFIIHQKGEKWYERGHGDIMRKSIKSDDFKNSCKLPRKHFQISWQIPGKFGNVTDP